MPVDPRWQEDIHLRLRDGDPLASTELFEQLLMPLAGFVQHRIKSPFPIDESDVETAVTDALFEYIEKPQRFDPGISSLLSYLRMAAHRNMQNIMKSLERRAKIEITLAPVEEMEDAWNSIADDNSPEGLEVALMKESAEEWGEWIREVIPDAADRELVFMMAEGERKTESFAEVLGVQDLPLTERRRLVKQAKDRLVKRLRRAREKAHPELNRKEER